MYNIQYAEPFLNRVLAYSWLGNTVADYLIALIVFLIALIVFKIFREYILWRLAKLAERTVTDIDETLIKIIRNVRPPFYLFLAVYVSFMFLDFGETIGRVVNHILFIWVAYLIAQAASEFIDYLAAKRLKRENKQQTQSALSVLSQIAKVVVWLVILLFVLSNIGVNINSFIATLGIGGLAVAFALQNILNDMFSSFSIYFDKPFEAGDFIIVGEHMGTVERIGIKTTRLRSLQGEEIVISNQELTTVRVQNFKKLKERRVVFNFGLDYNSPTSKIKKVPGIIKDIFDGVELARLDRAHFYRFGESALEFEVVYFIKSPDFSDYMDAQQQINLGLKDKLAVLKLEFAFPTRVVYQK